MKYSPNNLQKIENILLEIGYEIRYEKGNFQSGSCILEQQKMIVINKFLNIEGKTNTIIDILLNVDINMEILSEENKKILQTLQNKRVEILEESMF